MPRCVPNNYLANIMWTGEEMWRYNTTAVLYTINSVMSLHPSYANRYPYIDMQTNNLVKEYVLHKFPSTSQYNVTYDTRAFRNDLSKFTYNLQTILHTNLYMSVTISVIFLNYS